MGLEDKENNADYSEGEDINKRLQGILKENLSIVRETHEALKTHTSIATQLNNAHSMNSTQQRSILKSSNDIAKVNSKLAMYEDDILASKRSVKDITKDITNNLEASTLANSELYQLQEQMKNTTGEERELLISISSELIDQIGYSEDNQRQLESELAIRQKIEDKLGVMGKLMRGVSKIPIVGDLLDGNKALDVMTKTAEGTGGKMKVMGAGIGSLMGDIKKGAMDPLTIMLKMAEAIGKVDGELVEMSKSLNMSKGEAGQLRNELQTAATHSGDLFITTSKLIEAQGSLNKLLGTSIIFSGEILTQATKLTEKVKLSAEATAGLAQNSILVGGSFEDNYESALATSYEIQRQTGISVDLRTVMEQVGKVSGVIRTALHGSSQAIAEAVTKATVLGTTLEASASAGRSLLDFESSIANELEAELMLGKSLNLERARAAALTQDYATVAEELASQMGTFTEFGDLNALQAESYAKALGMTSDELANQLSLVETQNKSKRELIAMGREDLALQMEQTTAADKMSKMMAKLEGMFADLVGPLIPALDLIMSIINPIMDLVTFIDPIIRGVQTIVQGIVDSLMLIPAWMGGNQGDFSKTAAAAQATVEATKYSGKMLTGGNKEIEADDFTIKTHPKDELIMAGGTSLGGNSSNFSKDDLLDALRTIEKEKPNQNTEVVMYEKDASYSDASQLSRQNSGNTTVRYGSSLQ